MKETIFRVLAFLYPERFFEKMNYYKNVIYSYKFASKLATCGKGTRFSHIEFATGLNSVSVGSETIFLPHLFLTTWGGGNGVVKLSIGSHCSIGAYCHISAFNYISIGNHVLIGKWVSIVDNDHGKTDYENLSSPPLERKIFSKGSIVIGDKVWVGDKATILSGVTIGEGAVIAANAVVTKDVPAYTVVAGNPARIVKNANIMQADKKVVN